MHTNNYNKYTSTEEQHKHSDTGTICAQHKYATQTDRHAHRHKITHYYTTILQWRRKNGGQSNFIRQSIPPKSSRMSKQHSSIAVKWWHINLHVYCCLKFECFALLLPLHMHGVVSIVWFPVYMHNNPSLQLQWVHSDKICCSNYTRFKIVDHGRAIKWICLCDKH